MKSIKLSVITLTHNEEPVIVDCLKSVGWAEEIVIVDDSSTDKTLLIAKKNGVEKIIRASRELNFSERRNLGAKKASGRWLIYVDADERVTEGLKKEVLGIIKENGKYSAFAIPRKNIRLTKPLHFGGWWPDYVLRLMKKDKLVKWKGALHEQPEIEGKIGKLKAALIHLSHRGSLEHKVATTVKWSKIEAEEMFNSGHPQMNLIRFVSAMWREFFKRMIRYQGFRDGREGILEVFYQVFSVFISYARLWELQKREKMTRG